MCTWKCTRRGMFTLCCRLPLMIVVITSSGKSHFHKATFFPLRCHSFSITGLLSFSSILFCCLPPLLSFILPPLICMSPSLFILQLTLLPSPSAYPLWSAHPSLLLCLLPGAYFPSYTASPHPSIFLHLFIPMSKSHPFIFLQMSRLCMWERTGEKRSRGTQLLLLYHFNCI